MDTWIVLWFIGMLAYFVSMAFAILHTVQQRCSWKMVLYTGFVTLLAINWFRLKPWETRSIPPPVFEDPRCADLLTGAEPWARLTVNGEPVAIEMRCVGADGEITWVRAGGDAL